MQEEQGYSPLFYIGLVMLIVGVLGVLIVGGAGGM